MCPEYWKCLHSPTNGSGGRVLSSSTEAATPTLFTENSPPYLWASVSSWSAASGDAGGAGGKGDTRAAESTWPSVGD